MDKVPVHMLECVTLLKKKYTNNINTTFKIYSYNKLYFWKFFNALHDKYLQKNLIVDVNFLIKYEISISSKCKVLFVHKFLMCPHVYKTKMAIKFIWREMFVN